MATLHVFKNQFFDANGVPLSGGKIYSYAAGTSTAKSTYTDSTGSTQNANPTILNSRGEASLWLSGMYKIVLTDSLGATVWTVDNVANDAYDASQVIYTPYGTGSVPTTVQTKLRESVSVLDFYANGVSGVSVDPTGVVDSTLGIQAAINLGAGLVRFPNGTYLISSPIQLPQGISVIGDAGGQFTSIGTTIRNNTASSGVFWMTPTTTGGTSQDGPIIENFYLIADYPIKLNDPTVTISNSGAGLNPYIMHARIINVHGTGVTANVGTGLTLAKCFDFHVEGCSFTNANYALDIGILSIGSDIGFIGNNRIIAFNSYGILEISCGTFGSQTLIQNNDILVGSATSIFIKSCGRHPRIHNNYLETSGSTGAIDITNIGCPVYGANTPGYSYEISVKDNRIDGHSFFTSFVYRLDGTLPIVNTVLHDVGTIGLTSANELIVNGGYVLPTYSNYKSQYDIRIPFSIPYADFRTGKLPQISDGITLDATNFSLCTSLEGSTAAPFIGYNGSESIVIGTAMSVILNAYLPQYDSSSHPLEPGTSYTLMITAKSSASETLRVGLRDGTTGYGLTSLALTPQYKTYYVTQHVAPAANVLFGCYIARNGTYTANINIQSIYFVKNIKTGYGTPTGLSITTDFPGATATLVQTSGTLAQLITDLENLGIIGK
jgi:hypothetical protein